MGTKRVDVRLESDQWDRLEKFRLTAGIDTPSGAIRMLMEIGLRDSATVEAAWLKATNDEGHRATAKKFRADLEKMLGQTTRG